MLQPGISHRQSNYGFRPKTGGDGGGLPNLITTTQGFFSPLPGHAQAQPINFLADQDQTTTTVGREVMPEEELVIEQVEEGAPSKNLIEKELVFAY